MLGKQTRLHKDLDIIIQEKDVPILHRLLKSEGYSELKLEYSTDWNFVLADNADREIDVHVIVFDEFGNGVYGPEERGVMYPAASLLGSGVINGISLPCLTPEYQVVSHTGYKLTEKDYMDVFALCEKFKVELPDEYRIKY